MVWEADFDRLLAQHAFQRPVILPDLWESTPTLTTEIAHVVPFWGTGRHAVRCGLPFQGLLDKEVPPTRSGRWPVDALLRAFSKCAPKARDIFTGGVLPPAVIAFERLRPGEDLRAW